MSHHEWKPLLRRAAIALAAIGASVPLSARTQEARERNIVRLQSTDPPQLRLNARGHTGVVQTLAFTPDSRRLCSAGFDKTIQVWDLSLLPPGAQARDIRRRALREQVLRWQVNRGPRGWIYAMASAPNDGLLAVAGYGAAGGGEVALLRPVDGTLEKTLLGHGTTVTAVAFSADGKTLVTTDLQGKTLAWKRGEWTATMLRQPDAEVYEAAIVQAVRQLPRVPPIAVLGNELAVVPRAVSAPQQPLEWHLDLIGLADGKPVRRLAATHRGLVTSLAATADGRHLASADLAGRLFLWNLPEGNPSEPLPVGSVARSLAFSPEGGTLYVGTLGEAEHRTAELQTWDVARRERRSSEKLADHVHACTVSPDGNRVAYCGGARYEVFVRATGDAPAQPAIALGGVGGRIVKVAFSAREPIYRVAFGSQPIAGAFNDYGRLEASFDPTRSHHVAGGEFAADDWIDARTHAGDWTALPSPDRRTLRLLKAGVEQATITLDVRFQGLATCYGWIPGEDGKVAAIALGTDLQNGVFVYGLADPRDPVLLRYFRGHQDLVNSVAVSKDRRYLVSGSADGTLMFWSLAEHEQGADIPGKWGVHFEDVDAGGLVVKSLNEAGPMFRKGVRRGDVITRLRWTDDQGEHAAGSPQEMRKALTAATPGTQVAFDVARQGAARPTFQLLPAWQPLATLFVSDDREWAFWSPEGYYDASANGHTMFGWQVNRGVDRVPLFYGADQFRRNLERPDVMHQLLPTGHLEAALRAARLEPPADTSRVLAAQIVDTPTVEIVAPRFGDVVAPRVARVRAHVEMPVEGQIEQTRVFASGVVGKPHKVVGEPVMTERGTQITTYEWEVPLPHESKHLIQVYIGTHARTVGFARTVVEHPVAADPGPSERPRLYLLGVGVNDYRDPQVPDLEFSVNDAESVLGAWQSESLGLYDVARPRLLVGPAVTRAAWREALAQLAGELRETARPDDLLVVFLAGHGDVDEQTDTYHFLCHDVELSRWHDGSGTISWSDFDLLADIPCRKLALLDTCHSGAIQGLAPEQKLAMRAFQEKLVLTVAASAGGETSLERADWKHGAFTKTLLAGMAGEADASADHVVTLDELVSYVVAAVPRLTGDVQHPQAAPADVLPFVSLPLVKTPVPSR